jgi:outer membrane protein, heavy metal efflux system
MYLLKIIRTPGFGLPARIPALLFVTLLCSAMNSAAAEIDSAEHARIFERGLRRLLDEAQTANPSLRAAGRRTTAAAASADGKRGLSPPLVGVDFYQAPVRSFPNPVGGEVDYFLQQELPFPGKLSAMARAESKRAAMLGAEAKTVAADLTRDITTAYGNLYYSERKTELLRRNREALVRFEEIARTRYEVGLGAQVDVLRAQTELSSLVNDSIALAQERLALQATINALRNMPADSAIAAPPEIAPPLAALSFEAVKALALERRPELAAQKLSLAMREAEVTAAKKEAYPDFMVRGTYKQMRDAPDDWGVMVGLIVPMTPWSASRPIAARRASEALSAESSENLAGTRAAVESEVFEALSKVKSSQAQIAVIRGTILPQARQTVQSATAAYQTGKQDFLTLIEAERTLIGAELRYQTEVASLLAARAALERAAGLDIEDIEQSIQGGRR